MPFRTRLLALQWLTLLGLVAIGVGLLSLPFASSFVAPGAVVPMMGAGFTVALVCSIVLSRLRCPDCKETFCGPPYDENQRSSIFTSRCMACGMKPAQGERRALD